MYEWVMFLYYKNHMGDAIVSTLPAFKSYQECMDWIDIIYYHILSHNNISNFVATCDWVAS